MLHISAEFAVVKRTPPRFFRKLNRVWFALGLIWTLFVIARLVCANTLFWQMHVSLKSVVIEMLIFFGLGLLHLYAGSIWRVIMQVELLMIIFTLGFLGIETILLQRHIGNAIIRRSLHYDNSFAAFSSDPVFVKRLQIDDLKIPILTPGLHAKCEARGLRWSHATDNRGMRVPDTVEKADIVLIGDSYTYGFGVEIQDTIAGHLQQISGLKIAVIANPNSGMFSKWLQLRHDLKSLKPKAVVALPCYNDPIDDQLDTNAQWPQKKAVLTNSDTAPKPVILPMSQFGPVKTSYYLPLFRSFISPAGSQTTSVLKMLLKGSRIDPRFNVNPPYWPRLPIHAQSMPSDDHPGWDVTIDCIKRIDEACKIQKIPFTIIPVMPESLGPTVNMGELFRERIQAKNVTIIQPELWSDHPDYFLTSDGHFSSRGNAAVAHWIYQWYVNQKQ